jgi:hypothetical protein
MSEGRIVVIRSSDNARKELQERFSKASISCQEVGLQTLSSGAGSAITLLWVTLTVINQLTQILFEFKRNKKETRFKLVVGKNQETRKEILVQNERDFEQAAEDGIDEIHITDDGPKENV